MFTNIDAPELVIITMVPLTLIVISRVRRKAAMQLGQIQREMDDTVFGAVMRAIRTTREDLLSTVDENVKEDLEWVYELGVSVGANQCTCDCRKAA